MTEYMKMLVLNYRTYSLMYVLTGTEYYLKISNEIYSLIEIEMHLKEKKIAA